MIDELRAESAAYWQLLLDWNPHWLLQTVVGAVFVGAILQFARWIRRALSDRARLAAKAYAESKAKQEAETSAHARLIALRVRVLEHGAFAVVIEMIETALACVVMFIVAVTALTITTLSPADTPTLLLILGWSFFIAGLAGAGNQIRYIQVIKLAFENMEREQIDKFESEQHERISVPSDDGVET